MTIKEHLENAAEFAAKTANSINALPLTPEQKFELVQNFCVLRGDVTLALEHAQFEEAQGKAGAR